MIRVLEAVIGMRVVTPRGLVAKVTGISMSSEDIFSRVNIVYLDPCEGEARIQPKLLKGYDGPPVIFHDEAEQIRLRHGDKPLSPPPAEKRAAE